MQRGRSRRRGAEALRALHQLGDLAQRGGARLDGLADPRRPHLEADRIERGDHIGVVAVVAPPVAHRVAMLRDALRGDLLGYLDGIADALQEAGVVEDDKWILGWDGSRLDKDAAAPRVELVIGPLEAYREDSVEGTVY